jgi:hypothetical protein
MNLVCSRVILWRAAITSSCEADTVPGMSRRRRSSSKLVTPEAAGCRLRAAAGPAPGCTLGNYNVSNAALHTRCPVRVQVVSWVKKRRRTMSAVTAAFAESGHGRNAGAIEGLQPAPGPAIYQFREKLEILHRLRYESNETRPSLGRFIRFFSQLSPYWRETCAGFFLLLRPRSFLWHRR